MTFPPSDSPDWTAIPGALRYLGTIDMTGTGADLTGSLVVSPASYDGVIYVLAFGDPGSDSGNATVRLDSSLMAGFTSRMNYYRTGGFQPEVFTAFINAAIGGTWTVAAEILNANGSTLELFVFAAPGPNAVQLAGQAAPLLVHPQSVHRRPVDSALFHSPAAATLATVTFPATANQRWVLAYATWTLRNTAAVVGVASSQVHTASLGALYQSVLSIPAVADSIDREQFTGGGGISSDFNDALIVDFAAAGPASTVERISAGAWLLPPGE